MKKKIKETIERYHYETLAPIDDLNSNETINMLSDFLESKNVINIAVSGKYGVGKSSLIKSYFNKNENKKKYTPLYISLGMFGINKNDEIQEKDIFCKEIEKSVIQQIFYKEHPSKLSDSNIKRIKKKLKKK